MFSTLDSAYPPLPLLKGNYQLNNQQPNFPPFMSDGRTLVASWQPGTVVDDDILHKSNIQSNWQYRRYLSKHGDDIRKMLLDDALQDIGYTIRNVNPEYNQTFSSPYIFSFTDPIPSKFRFQSDLKNIYLTREQMQAQQVIPSINIASKTD